MLGKGSCPNVEDRTGCTPLEAAVSRGHDECIRALLARGADPNYVAASNPGQSRTRCLSKACMDGKFGVVKVSTFCTIFFLIIFFSIYSTVALFL